MTTLTDQLFAALAAHGYQGRIVSIRRLLDLQEGIETHHRAGDFDDQFYRQRLGFFRFTPPDALPDAQSIFVVAVPRPQTQAIFRWRGQPFPVIIPPTYTDYGKIAQQVTDLLAGLLEPAGSRIALAKLPLKLLAVHSGLAAYGRNNITYVPGLGSFYELVGLCSDLPSPDDLWHDLRVMDACRNCHACARRCPTGAIADDRFLLHTERCLVFHNEQPADVPFPAWIDPSWHNCLEGCMYCQRACPENKHLWDWVEGTVEFTEEETALLLQGVPQDRLSPETIAKLERLDVLADLPLFPRNLGVFLH
jgi:epoxyqueuosine reductase